MKILDKCRQITDTESGRVLLYRDEVEAVLTAGDTIGRQVAIKKRSPQERLIIAKTLIESVLDELPSVQPTQLNTPNTLEALDCIGRQAAIDALRMCQTYLFYTHDPDKKIGLESAEYEIEQLPSVQPEQRWIPCNWHTDDENLPDECKSVLICIKDETGTYVDVSYRTDYNRWERYGRNINVVAWMPLPEPYKAERQKE